MPHHAVMLRCEAHSHVSGHERRSNQEAVIYAELRRRRLLGQPLPLPDLLDLRTANGNRIAVPNARIHDLRHRYGLKIENRTEWKHRVKYSKYWLSADTPEAASAFGFSSALPPADFPEVGR